MITVLLAIVCAVLVLLWLSMLIKLVHNQRKAIKICRDFSRTIYDLALQNAETEPFARIVLDEHRKYNDQLFDLGEAKQAKTQGKAGAR